jgi:hypothetical protein
MEMYLSGMAIDPPAAPMLTFVAAPMSWPGTVLTGSDGLTGSPVSFFLQETDNIVMTAKRSVIKRFRVFIVKIVLINDK